MIIETTFMRGKTVMKHISFRKNAAMSCMLDTLSDKDTTVPHINNYFKNIRTLFFNLYYLHNSVRSWCSSYI